MPASGRYLRAAGGLGIAPVSRTHSGAEPAERDALQDVERRLEAELKWLERMESCGDSIRKNADTVSDEIRMTRKELEPLSTDRNSTLSALHIDLSDEAAARSPPISMTHASIQ